MFSRVTVFWLSLARAASSRSVLNAVKLEYITATFPYALDPALAARIDAEDLAAAPGSVGSLLSMRQRRWRGAASAAAGLPANGHQPL